MKHPATALLCLALLSAITFTTHAQSLVGKNLHQVIGVWGSNFNKLKDAEGLHLLQYKKVQASDTVTDVLYFEGFTCVKEVSLRPANEKNQYIDSLNRQYTPSGSNSWWGKDSTYVTMATRDGFLDITSFAPAYYKKISH